MLRVEAIDTAEFENRLLYNFQVVFGVSHNWVISRTYDDFSALHRQLCEVYGTNVVPDLPSGGVPWQKHSISASLKRLPHLEEYVSQVVNSCDDWQPAHFSVKVPNPDKQGALDPPFIRINKFLFDFLEFEQYLVVPSVRELAPIAVAYEASVATPQSTSPRPASPSPGTPRPVDNVPLDDAARLGHSAELAVRSATTITSAIRVAVRGYTIHRDDRIDYSIAVEFGGFAWIVQKRFSELSKFHDELVKHYSKQVPPIDEAKKPAWRKLDPRTGMHRQLFFTAYLRSVVASIDTWEPQGIVTTIHVDDGRVSEVRLNAFLFALFELDRHQADFNAAVIATALTRKQQEMSPCELDLVRQRMLIEKQSRLLATLQRRRNTLKCLDDAAFDVVVTAVREAMDDNEVMPLIHAELLRRPLRLGLRSKQLAVLCNAIEFHDTRVQCIQACTCLLVDIDYIDSVFETLLYDWTKAETDLRQQLSDDT